VEGVKEGVDVVVSPGSDGVIVGDGGSDGCMRVEERGSEKDESERRSEAAARVLQWKRTGQKHCQVVKGQQTAREVGTAEGGWGEDSERGGDGRGRDRRRRTRRRGDNEGAGKDGGVHRYEEE
jgi:hypothetical protein